jgi:hydroxyacylglutathione hydrolase
MKNEILVKRLLNFPVDSNCFVITKSGETECILVDPAQGDGLHLKSYLLQHGLRPSYIILTHEHYDHISSVQYLREQFGSQVIASTICSENITDPKKNLSLFNDQKGFYCSPADIVLEDEEYKWKWLDVEFLFLKTPGHSEGGICFFVDDYLFTGDTLLDKLKPVTKLPGGSKVILENSVKMLLERFNSHTIVFPGHGETFEISALTDKFKI